MPRILFSLITVSLLMARGASAITVLNVHGAVDTGCSFNSTSTVSAVSGSCGGPFGGNGDYAVIGSNLSASATYNDLKAYAFQDIGILANFYTIQTSDALAIASMSDFVALPTSYNQPANLAFGWTAEGTGFGSLTMAWGTTCVEHINTSTATCTSTQKILPGSKYNIQVILVADATLQFLGSDGNEVSRTSDFSHTATLTEVGLFDQDMNPLSGVHLVSDSGFDYQASVASPAPEPDPFVLTLCCIAVFLQKRLSQKSGDSSLP